MHPEYAEFLAKKAPVAHAVGIEPGPQDGGFQHIRRQAGKGFGKQDIVRPRVNQHLLVDRARHAFFGGDKPGAHIAEITSQRLGHVKAATVRNATGEHDRAVKETADILHEHERVDPAGLASGARRQQHKPVCPGGNGLFGMMHGRDIGKDERADIM